MKINNNMMTSISKTIALLHNDSIPNSRGSYQAYMGNNVLNTLYIFEM